MNIIKTTTENKVDLVRATNTTNTIQNIDSDKVLMLKDVIIYSTTDDNIIGKINGIVSSLYMLEIIDEPIIINNYFEANKLKKCIEEYLIKR